MKDSTRKHYRAEILRVLREEGGMSVVSLRRRVQPPPTSNAKMVSDDVVREVRREMEAEGLVYLWKDTSQRHNPLTIDLAVNGPRRIRSVTIVVDAVGLPAGTVSTEVRCQPVSVNRLPALVAEAVRKLVTEHSVTLNVRPAEAVSRPTAGEGYPVVTSRP